MSQPQQQESISYDDVIQGYRDQVNGLTHELILMAARLKNRDQQIEMLLSELEESRRPMPDVPFK